MTFGVPDLVRPIFERLGFYVYNLHCHLPFFTCHGLRKISSFAGGIGKVEEWKNGRVEKGIVPPILPFSCFSFHSSVQNAPIER